MRHFSSHGAATAAARTIATLVAAMTILGAAGGAEAALTVNRIITVPAAGTGAANCQALRSALAAIDDADSDKPYLVRLEPGVYECGDQAVSTQPHVDLEGSGRGASRIVFDGSSDVGLRIRPPGEIRHLTVQSTNSAGPAGTRCAVWAGDGLGGEARLTHVDLEASGGSFNCGLSQNSGDSAVLTDVGIEIMEGSSGVQNYGIVALTAAARLDGVRIRIDGSGGPGDPELGVGITDAGPDPVGDIRSWEIRDTRIEILKHREAYGVWMTSGVAPVLIEGSWIGVDSGADLNHAVHLSTGATIRRSSLLAIGDGGAGIALYHESDAGSHQVTVETSELFGSHVTVRNDTGFDTRIGGSLLSGPPVDGALGTLTCAAVWDEDFVFSADSCP